jgi:hypothetical protein
MPKRMYRAEHMRQGIAAMTRIQQAMDPDGKLMAKRIPGAEELFAAPPPEVLEAHCLACKGKKNFTVEGEEKMKNGTLRKYGKSDCGHSLSLFVSGKQASSVAA